MIQDKQIDLKESNQTCYFERKFVFIALMAVMSCFLNVGSLFLFEQLTNQMKLWFGVFNCEMMLGNEDSRKGKT